MYICARSTLKKCILNTSNRDLLNKMSSTDTKDYVKAQTGEQNVVHFQKSILTGTKDYESIPVAIVLGWAGGKDKHVAKYSEIYLNHGYHVFRLSQTATFSIFRTGSHKIKATELLDAIKTKYKLTKNPIIIHSFSNAGTFIYRNLSDMSNDPNQKENEFFKSNLKGIILDSGPGYFLGRGVIKPFIQNLVELVQIEMKNVFLSYFISIFGLAIFYFHHHIFSFGKHYFHDTIKALINDKIQVPILAFYSTKDRMIYYKATEDFFAKRLQAAPGVKLDAVRFEDTEHVSHYMKHKKEYGQKIDSFLRELNLPLNRE